MARKWTEFDEYADKIRQADGLSLTTAPLTGTWDFAQHLLPRTILQFGSGADGTIVHAVTRADAGLLFMPSTQCADRIVFDGRIMKWPEIVMVPPATHYAFACTGPTQWISLSVPIQLGNGGGSGGGNGGFKKHLVALEGGKTLIAPPADNLVRFIEAATAARDRLQHARPKQLQAIETSLLGILDGILWDSVSERRCFNQRTEKVMSKVLEFLRRDNQIHVLALAQAAGVSERTLHRAFKKYFHIGPKRYSKIRQLNLVRRAIRQGHAAPVNVTGILTKHGVTEFGRFAIEYKALFHESPAETLQRQLIAKHDGSGMSYGPTS